MTRRTRTAALLSATALLAGATLSLALAPAAVADIPTPPLGSLSADNDSPTAGDLVKISGTGCFTLAPPTTPPSTTPSSTAPSDGTDAAPAAAPTTTVDDPPAAGSIDVVINGPGSFHSTDSATASDDGTWTAAQGITVGNAGSYTVTATCTLTDPVLGQQVGFEYQSLSLEVAAPPQVVNPVVACSGCSAAKPGSSVVISGRGFPKDTTASVTLAGYAGKASAVDGEGFTDPVSIVIRADQAAGTLRGTVAAPGITPVAFQVVVTVPDQPGAGSADGPVDGTDTDGTDTGAGDTTDFPATGTGTNVSSAPTLPATGTDSVWPGVIGGLLVVSGAGLLWAGRRREDADVTVA